MFHDANARENLGVLLRRNPEKLKHNRNGRVVQTKRAARAEAPLRTEMSKHLDRCGVIWPHRNWPRREVFCGQAEGSQLVCIVRPPVKPASRRD